MIYKNRTATADSDTGDIFLDIDDDGAVWLTQVTGDPGNRLDHVIVSPDDVIRLATMLRTIGFESRTTEELTGGE